MKQKAVIRVSMYDDKSRTKALKTVVGTASGVDSIALRGAKKDEVEVIGDGIDPTVITVSLRKKVADAELISVVEVKKEEKKPDPPSPSPTPTPTSTPPTWSYNYPYYYCMGHHHPSCYYF